MTGRAAPAVGSSLWSAFLPLLPLMAAIFFGYLAMGMAMPVVPRHVHGALGQGTAVVGLVMGSQYASSFFARIWAGEVSDVRGSRTAALAGLVLASCTGFVYLASLLVVEQPGPSTGVLVAGRLLTGVAESFLITGVLTWGVMRVGAAHAGKVLGWVGVALFAAFAAGAPIGTALHARFGFEGVAWAVVVVPLLTLAGVRLVTAHPPSTLPRPHFTRVIGDVKLPGFALMLCAGAYAMIFAFAVLLFSERGWGNGGLAISSMGVGFIVARLLVGHLPDQKGGAQVAFWCVLVEAAGLLMIWAAPHASVALLGAALAGGGYAIGFQGFGVEAVRRAPAQSRGAAMGAYVAFQDLSMGLAAPLGGLLAQASGLGSVYLAAAIMALGAAGIAWALRKA